MEISQPDHSSRPLFSKITWKFDLGVDPASWFLQEAVDMLSVEWRAWSKEYFSQWWSSRPELVSHQRIILHDHPWIFVSSPKLCKKSYGFLSNSFLTKKRLLVGHQWADFCLIFLSTVRNGLTLRFHKKRQKSNFWDTKTDSKSPTHELSIDILLEKIWGGHPKPP